MNWPPKRVYKQQIKAQKLDQVIGPQIINDSSLESLKTIFSTLTWDLKMHTLSILKRFSFLKKIFSTLENFPLSDSEKSVLSKGLNFVPISEKAAEFSIKQDVEKFLLSAQLKAFFHDEEDDSNTSNKDTFETL